MACSCKTKQFGCPYLIDNSDCPCQIKKVKPSFVKIDSTGKPDRGFVNDGTCDKCQIAGHLCQCGFRGGCPLGTCRKQKVEPSVVKKDKKEKKEKQDKPARGFFVNDGTCDKCQIAGHVCQCHFSGGCPLGTH